MKKYSLWFLTTKHFHLSQHSLGSVAIVIVTNISYLVQDFVKNEIN